MLRWGWIVWAVLGACSRTDGYEDFLADVPDVCVDVCEEAAGCQLGASTGSAQETAFAAAVNRCAAQCGVAATEGVGVWQSLAGERVYTRMVDGETYVDALACFVSLGVLRCWGETEFSYGFLPPTEPLCDRAVECLVPLELDWRLVWKRNADGIGGRCAQSGDDHVDAPFFPQ